MYRCIPSWPRNILHPDRASQPWPRVPVLVDFCTVSWWSPLRLGFAASGPVSWYQLYVSRNCTCYQPLWGSRTACWTQHAHDTQYQPLHRYLPLSHLFPGRRISFATLILLHFTINDQRSMDTCRKLCHTYIDVLRCLQWMRPTVSITHKHEPQQILCAPVSTMKRFLRVSMDRWSLIMKRKTPPQKKYIVRKETGAKETGIWCHDWYRVPWACRL